jgi:YesN/AraC family two-component response regulator
MRVLIVDDEALIRDGLRSLIDWADAGFDRVDDAKNAVEAMERIEQAAPDLVITDIFMPEMSGLEFVRTVRGRRPDIRFIILTGYEKFEYAKEAVELGVVKYLVKPIFPDELRQAVEEVRDELLQERRRRDWQETARRQLEAYKPVIVEKFWRDVLDGALPTNEAIRERAGAAEIPLDYAAFSCAAIQICRLENVYERYGERDLALVRFAIRNIVTELLPDRIIHIADDSDTTLVCIASGEVEAGDWRMAADAIERTLKIDVSVGAGRTCAEPACIHASAREALDSVKYLSMLDQTGFIRYEDIPSWKKDSVEYPYEQEKELLDAVRYRDQVPDEAAAPFFDKLMAQHPTPQMIRLTCVQLLGAVYRLADEYGIDSIPTFRESVSRLESLSSVGDIRQMLTELLRTIAAKKNCRHASFVAQLAEQAKRIMRDRFREPDMSVARMASMLCVTPNYLSRIFHQHTGVTCVEFLTECRLEEAKKLLTLTEMKTYEVAERVGYANAHYFSFLFKKNVGCSPTEYRERYGSGAGSGDKPQ